MASFNKLIILGNLTRDPEMRYLPNNSPVVEFGMAVNRKWKDANGQDKEEVMFLDVTAFGKPAEILNQYCHKGDLLFVEGRLKLETWEDKQGGGKRSKHKAVVENFQLMPNGNRDSAPAPQRSGDSRAGSGTNAAPRRAAPASKQQEFREDDVPAF